MLQTGRGDAFHEESIVKTKTAETMTLGKTIRAARTGRELTLRDLAETLEMSFAGLGEIELDRRIPSAELLRRIADELGLDEDDLRAKAGKLTDDEIAYMKTNPVALKLLIAMMGAGYGQTETEGLVRQVKKRR
jgi:transcriptional regulator with XRE-family HTH domain